MIEGKGVEAWRIAPPRVEKSSYLSWFGVISRRIVQEFPVSY
jgi:hypothetical protein